MRSESKQRHGDVRELDADAARGGSTSDKRLLLLLLQQLMLKRRAVARDIGLFRTRHTRVVSALCRRLAHALRARCPYRARVWRL